MSIYVGNTKIGQMYLGSTEIAEAYLGSTKVYDKGGAPALPAGYTLLPFVSSVDDGGWVDTEILPNDTFGYRTKFMFANVTPSAAVNSMGARQDSGDTRCTFGVTESSAFVSWRTFPSSASNRIAISASTWYNLRVNWENSRVWMVGNVSKSLSGTLATFTKPFQIFGIYSTNGRTAAKAMSIGRIEFSNGTTIIADMIPCTSPNNEVGFYDVVRERFFGSGNGIPLIAGS